MTAEQLMFRYMSDESQDDFAALYNLTHESVRRYSWRYVRSLKGCNELLDEIVQEVYAAVHTQRASFSEGPFLKWAFGLARNIGVGVFRRERRRQMQPLTGVVTDSLQAHETPDREQAARVQQLLATLPDDDRQVFEAHYFRGVSFRTLAKQRGVARNTLMDLVHKHLRTLAYT